MRPLFLAHKFGSSQEKPTPPELLERPDWSEAERFSYNLSGAELHAVLPMSQINSERHHYPNEVKINDIFADVIWHSAQPQTWPLLQCAWDYRHNTHWWRQQKHSLLLRIALTKLGLPGQDSLFKPKTLHNLATDTLRAELEQSNQQKSPPQQQHLNDKFKSCTIAHNRWLKIRVVGPRQGHYFYTPLTDVHALEVRFIFLSYNPLHTTNQHHYHLGQTDQERHWYKQAYTDMRRMVNSLQLMRSPSNQEQATAYIVQDECK